MRFIRLQENDYYYARTYPISKALPQYALFITGRSWIVEGYFERFTAGVHIVGLEKVYVEQGRDSGKLLFKTREAIAEALSHNMPIYVSYDAINPGKDVMENPAHQQLLKDFWQPYTFDCKDVGMTKLCRIVP